MGRPSLHHRTGGGDQRRRDDAPRRARSGEIAMPRARYALLALLVLSGCSVRGDRAPDSALERGCRFLWSQQSDDGGWHSRTYGLMKSGQSLTPFVLNTLLQVPESSCRRPAGAVDRAIGFLKRN